MTKKRITSFYFTFVIVFCSSISILAQNDTSESKKETPKTKNLFWLPRTKANADKPGKYELVIRIKNNEIEKGDSVEIDGFITGYGNIGLCKLYVLPSSNWFYEQNSSITYGLKLDTSTGKMIWNAETRKIYKEGLVTSLMGIQLNDGSATMFLDQSAAPGDLLISTELETKKHTPFHFKYASLKKLDPGIYTINFVLTYFNGQEWQNSVQTASIKVKNVFERNVIASWIFGIIGLFIAIISVIPLLKQGIEITYKSRFCQWLIRVFEKWLRKVRLI